jgi:hypothetical protein
LSTAATTRKCRRFRAAVTAPEPLYKSTAVSHFFADRFPFMVIPDQGRCSAYGLVDEDYNIARKTVAILAI